MYWTWIIAIIVVVFIIWSFYSNTYEYFFNDQLAYYQQHSRYPTSAWWIPVNEPIQACQLKARE